MDAIPKDAVEGENGLKTVIQLTEDACAQEAITSPGSIQAHGVLIGYSTPDLRMVTQSANFILACSQMGVRFDAALAPEIHACLSTLASGPEDGEKTFVADVPGFGSKSVHCFRADDVVFLEFELDEPSTAHGDEARLGALACETLSSFAKASDLTELGRILVDVIARNTGLERVLLYRFDEDGHGDVIAEYLEPSWNESLLGLHFPSSDIPAQARDLYKRVHARWTPVRDHTRVPLSPAENPITGRPFEIGRSRYRALSPVHTLYMKNLGVDGSMSVSILQDEALWGLIVGHHRSACHVALPVQDFVSSIVWAFSLRLKGLAVVGEADTLVTHTERLTHYLSKLAGAEDFVDALLAPPSAAIDLFPGTSGIAVIIRNRYHYALPTVKHAGETPPDADIHRLLDWLRAFSPASVIHTDCISSIYPAFYEHSRIASGVLVAFIGEERDQAIMWFRPEFVREIAWSGRPEKLLDATGTIYLPRRSFARWVEKQHCHSLRWQRWELHIAKVFRDAIIKVILRQSRRIGDLNSEVDRFLWVTSHHLRETPRRVAIGCDLIRRSCDVPSYRAIEQIVAPMKADALDMDMRLRGLLAYLEFGHSKAALGRVAVDDIFAAILDAHAERMANAEATIHILSDLPEVMADEYALRFVFESLLDNCLKFAAPSRPLDIRVWAERRSNYWQIALADNGIGIPHEYLEKVFELFETLGPAGSDRGIGVGLTLCRRIAEGMGGEIWLQATAAQGTTVNLLLSAMPSTVEDEAAPPARVRTVKLLRDATKTLHQQVEEVPLMAPLSQGRVTVSEYRDALTALAGFYRPVEEVLFTRFADTARHLGLRPKLPALINDLTALGLSQVQVADLPTCQDIPKIESVHRAAGIFYVLEGATLGGQVVLRRIAHCLGPLLGKVTSFHGFHLDNAGPHWRAFEIKLEALSHMNASAQQDTLEGAVEAFGSLLDWLGGERQFRS